MLFRSAAAWSSIANPRIRFTGTLGGNLMAGRPRYEGAVLLSAAQARLEFASLTGVQTIQVPDLSSSLLQSSAPAFQQPRLLTHIHLPTTDLVSYFYERSMRPLMTLAAALRLRGDGLQLCVAVATEYLKPALLLLPLRAYALADVARQARAIALDAFAQLPADFADPVITCDCARAAGTALLARRLERLAGLAHV